MNSLATEVKVVVGVIRLTIAAIRDAKQVIVTDCEQRSRKQSVTQGKRTNKITDVMEKFQRDG